MAQPLALRTCRLRFVLVLCVITDRSCTRNVFLPELLSFVTHRRRLHRLGVSKVTQVDFLPREVVSYSKETQTPLATHQSEGKLCLLFAFHIISGRNCQCRILLVHFISYHNRSSQDINIMTHCESLKTPLAQILKALDREPNGTPPKDP